MIVIVVGALGSVLKSFKKRLEKVEIPEGIETILIAALLRQAEILEKSGRA